MTPTPNAPGRLAVVGAGRLGTALAAALTDAHGPFARGFDGSGADVILLCVPDDAIATAAGALSPREGLLVGHCSGARGLDVLHPHEAFSVHPLMTVTGPGAPFVGAGGAVSGSTPRALDTARAIAAALGLCVGEVADADRAAYHAAASMASNFLVTLESAAELLLPADRELLVPLVRATVEGWAEHGAAALTGPIARGDHGTEARQRAAVADRTPELLAVWDALAAATHDLAGAPA